MVQTLHVDSCALLLESVLALTSFLTTLVRNLLTTTYAAVGNVVVVHLTVLAIAHGSEKKLCVVMTKVK
ncbi:hypothetical protein AcW1_005487 [Taiwanofungus camphoratus]|nr:hypothetical protein AcW2_004252 [Antrodia cinnamomea]KAI0933739.1 hypothetical protein AcV5_005809 [Antrodia cinnamomea]KAI0956930.1 hypothetical protein AcW1_005487 [Antrodia cinnamomea]